MLLIYKQYINSTGRLPAGRPRRGENAANPAGGMRGRQAAGADFPAAGIPVRGAMGYALFAGWEPGRRRWCSAKRGRNCPENQQQMGLI
jgi:hypothetical protein